MRQIYLICLLGTLLGYATSATVDYDQQVVAQGVVVDNLMKDYKALLVRLQGSVNKNSIRADKMASVETKNSGERDDIIAKNKVFMESLKKNNNDKLTEGEEKVMKYIKDEMVEKRYKVYLGDKLLPYVKKMALRYSADDSKDWVKVGLKRYSEEVQQTVDKLDESKVDIAKKLDVLLKGELSEKEKQEKLAKIKELQNDFYLLARQVQLNQFHEEEKQRSDGQSGIKQIRTRGVGSKNYHANTHSGGSFSAIHDHSNNIRTVGMGEFIGVLNGVEFRTRHNDYRLKQPGTTTDYHKTEDVKFPDIPPEVTRLTDINEQIAEMREWFKAFYEQNKKVRDYTKYFKPVLVYLEGAWSVGKAGGAIDEPFESDRHHIAAKTWLDLQEKVRLTSYHGTKSILENLAHLPTKIIRFTPDKQPVLAQWNYRILCHPLKDDLPLKNLKLVLDPATQRMRGYSNDKYRSSRSAKFDIGGIDINGSRTSYPMAYSYLDYIMEQVPGKDNYGASIVAQPFDAPTDKLYSANPNKKNEELNAAYYHRAYIQKDKDGKQVHYGQRGFSDRVYVAHNTRQEIAHVSHGQVHTKVSYAVPVEIIYLTPLHSWNPFNLKHAKKGDTVNGTGTQKMPFSHIGDRNYYITPSSFFSGTEVNPDAADTAKGGLYVTSTSGTVYNVRASGTRINFPPIKIGSESYQIRQRYPVMPVFGEGSAIWKRLNAVEDALHLRTKINGPQKYFTTGFSHSKTETLHQHVVSIPESDYNDLKNRRIEKLVIVSEEANGHEHRLTIARKEGVDGAIYIKDCGPRSHNYVGTSDDQVCFDYHTNTLT